MTTINARLAAPSQQSTLIEVRAGLSGARTPRHGEFQAPRLASGKAEELREAFTQFVGEAFYGQMLKAMRATVGNPAYFHGGRAEEVFQGQLDQQMVEHLTEATAQKFAEPLFERQFPHMTGRVQEHGLNELMNLRRG
jgi:hypothetical protein